MMYVYKKESSELFLKIDMYKCQDPILENHLSNLLEETLIQFENLENRVFCSLENVPNFHIKQGRAEKGKVYFISQTMDLGLVISSITCV